MSTTERTPARMSQGKSRSRAAAKEASRAALMIAAVSLIAKKGLDVSLDEICAKAGYTRGAFYVHFEDRDALIAAVMKEVSAQWLETTLAGSADGDLAGLMGRVASNLKTGAHPLSRKGGVRPFQLFDAAARSDTVRAQYHAILQTGAARLADVLAAGQTGGAVRADVSPRALAEVLQALVVGLEVLHDADAPLDIDAGAGALLTILAPTR